MKIFTKTFFMVSSLIFFSFLARCFSKQNPAPYLPFNEWIFEAGISDDHEVLQVSKKFYYITRNFTENPPALINKPDWKFVFAYSKNFDQIAYQSSDKNLKIYSINKTVTLSQTLTFSKDTKEIKAVFSPDGKHLVIISSTIKEGDYAFVFSTETGNLEHKIPEARNFGNFKIGYSSLTDAFYTQDGWLVLKAKDYENDRYFVFASDGSALFSVILPPEVTTGVEANFYIKAKSPKENLAAFETTLVGTKHYKYSNKLDKSSGPFVVELKTGKVVFDGTTLPGFRFFIFLNESQLVLKKSEDSADVFCVYDVKTKKIISSFEHPKEDRGFFGLTKQGQLSLNNGHQFVLRDSEKVIFDKKTDSLFSYELESGNFVLVKKSGLEVISKKDGETLFFISYSFAPDTKYDNLSFTEWGKNFFIMTTKNDLVVFDFEAKKAVLKKPKPSYHSQVIPLNSHQFLTTRGFKPGISDFRALTARPKDTLLLWEISNP